MKIIKSTIKKITNLPALLRYNIRAENLANHALYCNEQGISNEKYFNEEIIVSLTTYEKRFHEVYLTVESIMQQTVKPNRIILWLSEEMKCLKLPIVLQRQQKRGLEIRYCKDILSYKKLIPTLQHFPSAIIITIDDDQFYHFSLLENMINAYRNNPNIIYCGRMHRMKLASNSKPIKYKKWSLGIKHHDISPLNFPTGSGAVLYPPDCLDKEVLNEEVFTKICKYADDIWFKAMALKNGFMSKKIDTGDKIRNENVQESSLGQINVAKNMNDVQLKAVFDKYNLYERLNV